nr:choice-of-anchor P family protein [Kibdelosporangium sp. MJ126-NF4]CEL17437.1 hypothetical protein [Kibdelosporangium sp. MJ126-NF4]CTQ91336.1 hypothetical protein [Kibdelosporangium sp. MJ126-NF4]
MRSSIVRRAFAVAGIAAIGLAIGAGPALAAESKAYSKAELLTGNLFGQTIVNPIVQEFPPGGTIKQPSVNVLGVVGLDLVGLGASATGDQAAGKSQAAINAADATLTVGIPNVGQLKFTENALDTKCTADGGVLTGSTSLAGARLQLTGPLGVSLLDVNIPVDAPPNTGIQLPGGVGEVLINKQVRKNGVITVSAVSAQILGTGFEFGKVTCGPNIPEPQVPVVSPVVGGAAAGLALVGLAGFGVVRHRRKAEV